MKEIFVAAELELIQFEAADVITTSQWLEDDQFNN